MEEKPNAEEIWGASSPSIRAEKDHAVRIWAELAIIEQGSVGIVRHLQSLIRSPAGGGMPRFVAARPSRTDVPREIV
jgi:hypothetical protein